ncbi:MAG: hypothetical protein GY953_53185, partial [bacterium]|nr:hypothetical protein [bacterium]
MNESVTMGRDHRDSLAERLAEATACRYTGGEMSEGAREFSGASIVDKARVCLQANGIRPPSFNRGEVIRLAMQSTSDFPTFLESTANRMMLRGYLAAEAGIKKACRPSTAGDFRDKYGVRLSEMPNFLEVNEGAQITTAPVTETKENYALATYGRGVSFTRQMLIN